MAKKQKGPKKKWNRAHFFLRQKSNKERVGHPVYVYGTSGRVYKFLLFTHTPEEGKESEFIKLRHNIDSKDPKDSYMLKKFRTSRDEAFDPPDKKYRIHEEDRCTVKKHMK